MAVTKLRADAPPFFSHCRLQFPSPPPPQCMAASPFHPAACSPPSHVVPNYQFAPILAPAPGPIYGFPPPPHPAAVPVCPFLAAVPQLRRRKAKTASGRKDVSWPLKGTRPFLRKPEPSPPLTEPVLLSTKVVPSPPPPAPVSRELLPHGSAPHKLMGVVSGGVAAEKPQEQAKAAATMAPAAEPVKPGQELAPAPAAGPRHGRQMTSPRSLRGQLQPAERGSSKVKEVGRRQAKEPVEPACKPAATSPSTVFTTRPPSPIPPPEWRKRRVTTVMIRNIPNKLKPEEMVQLLDEHCARANSKKKKKPVVAAYDFLYLPMDFSKCSNMGYAFVNLTTPEAARGLHYALHGARWKVHGTKKIIDIRSARIQGKDALVSHFSGSTFPCHTDEYLPATFSPPRDGAAGSSSPGTYVGNRVHTPAPLAPQPLPVPPAPQQQEWRPVERVVQASG